MKIKLFLALAAVLVCASSVFTADEALFPGTKGKWKGFDDYHFKIAAGEFGELSCRVVCPGKPAPGSPWIWRAVFFGHKPQAEIAMLNRGYYVAWIGCTDRVGSPQRNIQCDAFYRFLTGKGLSRKPCLLGMSRGGLCAMNWAIANPDKVGSIYIDNPVLDFKTWPGGFIAVRRSAADWESVMRSYRFKDEEEAKAYKGNPVDAFAPLSDRKIPILLICGTADRVVPYEFNGKLLYERYAAAGGPVTLVLKPGHDHRPHALKDPKIIVEFFLNPPKTSSLREASYRGG